MAIELPITNGYYVSTILPISHQRCSNVYVSIPSKPSLSSEQLLFTPGVSLLTTTGQVLQANRGSHVKNSIPYFVNGTTLYSVIQTIDRVEGQDVKIFSTVSLGTIEGTGEVSMADNGIQLMVLVPGGKGYIYNENAGTPFQEITDSDFTANGNPQKVVFIDAYFLMTTDEKRIIISNLNDGLSYSALDFTSAESDPDSLVAPIVLDNLVYALGTETTEGFQNLPSVGRMPFVRNGIVLDKGCKAPFSVVKSNSSFFMVGAGVDESPAIWQFFQGSYRKKSTEVIDQLLSTYSEAQIEAISAFAYSEAGSYFIIFNLPDTTLCFNLMTERWSERNSYIDDRETRSRVSSLVTAYGRLLVGDYIDGRIGHLSTDYVKEYDDNLIRLFTTQPFANQGDEITSTMLELTMESGVGDTYEKEFISIPGTNPDVLEGLGDCTTDWMSLNRGSNWSYDSVNSEYDCDGSQTSSNFLYEDTGYCDFGVTYVVTYTLKNWGAGSIRCQVGPLGYGTYRSADGTYAEIITQAGAGVYFYFLADSSFIGSVTDVTIVSTEDPPLVSVLAPVSGTVDPVVSLAISSNAKTFSNERVRKIGKKGEYHRRTVWYKNGRQDRFVVYQFRMSEPVKSAFIKLEYEP